jgi:hypothetical protein
VESLNKLVEPTCKRDVQKMLGMVNYLRWFISSLAGKVETLLPLIQLKHEKEFAWGQSRGMHSRE